MSELIRLIDDYRDRAGQPSEASVARAIGVRPQTINSWRTRAPKYPLKRDTLERLAKMMGLPYKYVLHCSLYDTGWVSEKPRLEDFRGLGSDERRGSA